MRHQCSGKNTTFASSLSPSNFTCWRLPGIGVMNQCMKPLLCSLSEFGSPDMKVAIFIPGPPFGRLQCLEILWRCFLIPPSNPGAPLGLFSHWHRWVQRQEAQSRLSSLCLRWLVFSLSWFQILLASSCPVKSAASAPPNEQFVGQFNLGVTLF